ncbi:MAG: N-(5'-phosphoribosyl)anthranilate isomerase [Armatimonadetes bacterium CG_4_10_14_0_8_um_filter_66_14]|nr:MAG: N-(5'-phosphoribosyl)anthranilate isomerase [Armatimonadetes bacterium CG06_land_8_20_14_3_00_66_21]PIX42890.1 MAG: N-(5'-phosphoribosyl)anthranilate isomerase [Armatimonadetes bacterium CG_4_8_14_3_um_filter_66_20]PIZ30358.1 MAG: N-(5'-phosphoribosyl)anthranilate isomerase [Armatimonadetes bacterium CG_4_10_14_0_8_um_filter_66_14]
MRQTRNAKSETQDPTNGIRCRPESVGTLIGNPESRLESRCYNGAPEAPLSVKVKICGITNLEDALVVRDAGADYVGCVIDCPRSPRSVSARQARVLFDVGAAVPVAVVVSPPAGDLERIESTSRCAVVQLSGDETPGWIQEHRRLLGSEVWKTVHLSGQVGAQEFAEAVAQVEAYLSAGVNRVLLDRSKGAGGSKQYGGTGESPDWEACARLRQATGASVVLAGGLGPETVAEAVRLVRPYAVDVSSGVEASPGRKNAAAVERFIAAARDG